MSLIEEYKQQVEWRDWATAMAKCPITPGQRVLDLGCGIGDVSRELANRGAIITAVDVNPELLAVARSCAYANCTFIQQDATSLTLAGPFDGLWSSFVPAYFTNFNEVFARWTSHLTETAWVCLCEADDLLGHEPLSAKTRQMVKAFYKEALQANRYDFQMGRKLEAAVKRHGFSATTIPLKDKELSFDGPASMSVLQAWSNRLSRMGGLQSFLREEFNAFQEEFLGCLSSASHRSHCKVVCILGVR